jgi:hypothetical protein
VLTHDEARRNVQELGDNVFCPPGVYDDDEGGYADDETIIHPFGFYEVGSIEIGKE